MTIESVLLGTAAQRGAIRGRILQPGSEFLSALPEAVGTGRRFGPRPHNARIPGWQHGEPRARNVAVPTCRTLGRCVKSTSARRQLPRSVARLFTFPSGHPGSFPALDRPARLFAPRHSAAPSGPRIQCGRPGAARAVRVIRPDTVVTQRNGCGRLPPPIPAPTSGRTYGIRSGRRRTCRIPHPAQTRPPDARRSPGPHSGARPPDRLWPPPPLPGDPGQWTA